MTKKSKGEGFETVNCGSLPPVRWSLLHMFYEHGDALWELCQREGIDVKPFLTKGKAAKREFKGDFKDLLNEVQSGKCRAYVPPRPLRFEFYEYDKWGKLVRETETFILDSLSLAKVFCGVAKTLVLRYRSEREDSTYYHFVLMENPKTYSESLTFDALVEAIGRLRDERRRLPKEATTALKRLYLSRVHKDVVYEVVIAEGGQRSNLKAVERLPLYNLTCYRRLHESLEKSAKYLHEEDAYNVAVEVAESLEAYFETGRIEHLYDALRVLHGVANKENCDAACWYARVLLPGIREVVEGGPC